MAQRVRPQFPEPPIAPKIKPSPRGAIKKDHPEPREYKKPTETARWHEPILHTPKRYPEAAHASPTIAIAAPAPAMQHSNHVRGGARAAVYRAKLRAALQLPLSS